MQKENSTVEIKKQKALQVSIKEGAANGFSASIGETYITPFALAIKASSAHIGILSAVSGLLAPLAQFFGSTMMENRSRKKIVLTFVLLQTLMWLPIISLGYLFWKGIAQDYLIYFLIIFYSLLAALGGMAYPAWFSWMGDLVPENKRGKYFSRRNQIVGVVSLAVVLIGAILLDTFKTKGLLLLGFSTLFALAFTFRFISYYFMQKQYAPPFKLKRGYYFSIFSFIKRFDNFGKFAVFQAFFNFALMIASPFFAVYMLEELNFSYVTYTIVIMSSSVFYLLFSPIAGKFSDRYGNRKLLYIASILFSINPILWIIIKKPILLIFIPQIVAGLANAALVIAATNFTYGAVSQQRRGICAAYTNILAGIGVFLGSLLGGWLISNYHPSSINPFMFVFFIAALCRAAVTLLFMPYIKEERHKKRLPPMYVNFLHPFKTLQAEIGFVKKIL